MSRLKGVVRDLIDDDFDYNAAIKSLKNNGTNGTNGTSEIDTNKMNNCFIMGPNKPIYDTICDFIHLKFTEKILLVRGPTGSGKSTLVKKCIIDSGYRYEEFNQEFEEGDGYIEDITRMLTSNSMEEFLNTSKAPYVIIIKDFDNSLRAVQQNELFSFITKSKVPVILLSSTKKKYPKFVKSISINIMQQKELLDIAKLHNLDKTITIENLNKAAEICHGDIRHFMESAAIGAIRDYVLDTKEKFINIIKYGTNVSHYCSLFTNSVTYTNYIKWSGKKENQTNKNTLSILSDIMDIISYSDTIYGSITSNARWDDYVLMNSMNILATIYPVHYLENNNKSFLKIINSEKLTDSEECHENIENIEKESEQNNEIIDNTKNSNANSQNSIIFFKNNELNYIIRYILKPSEYKQFIIDNDIKYGTLKTLCIGLSKENNAYFRKMYKEVSKISDDDLIC